MRHARPDYQDRIIDKAGIIPADEPVFLIRATDITGPATLRYWANQAWANGADRKGIVQLALDHADEMERWQKEHGRKIPDAPGDSK